MDEDTKYLARLKGTGMTDLQIAEKMGKTEDWVKNRWEKTVRDALSRTESGYNELVQLFNLLCLQHSLTSETLKSLGLVFANTVDQATLSKAIESCPPNLSLEQHILDSFIVLKRFIPEDPMEQLQRHVKSN